MKRQAASQIIKEMDIQITMRHYFPLSIGQRLRLIPITSMSVRKQVPSHTVGRSISCTNFLGEQFAVFIKQIL